MLRRLAPLCLLVLALAAAAPAAAQTAAPAPAPVPFDPNQEIPSDPLALAATITSNTTALYSAIDSWRAVGDPSVGSAPPEVTAHAVFDHRIALRLATRPRLYRAVVKLLPPKLAAGVRDIYIAKRSLNRLAHSGARRRRGAALPADQLLAFYREAQGQFGIRPRVLAAINLVETGFNRDRTVSGAGAKGPMQFLPSTWRQYGLGGNIRDPHDAILGAANYLRASGAPRRYRRAIYAYDHSKLYVEAIARYSRAMARDPHVYYVLHSWRA